MYDGGDIFGEEITARAFVVLIFCIPSAPTADNKRYVNENIFFSQHGRKHHASVVFTDLATNQRLSPVECHEDDQVFLQESALKFDHVRLNLLD